MDNTKQFVSQIKAAADSMVCRGDTVLCAVSGGADSVALLRVLLELRTVLGIRVCACHVHHGLRGAEADRDEAFVHALCKTYGVPCSLLRYNVADYAKAHGLGLEEAGRSIRYRALQQAACALGANKIALAHTLDDNLETMLFHLARGSGSLGLAGIPPIREVFIRPLLGVTRVDIEAYLATLGQSYVTDSSNLTDDFTRNRIRHEIVPVLRQLNPRCAEAAGRAAHLLRMDEAYLSTQAEALLTSAEIASSDGVLLQCDTLLHAPEALRTRVFRSILRKIGMPMAECTAGLIRRLDALLAAASPSGEIDLPNGLTAARQYEKLYCGRKQTRPTLPEIPLHANMSPIFWNSRTTLTIFHTEHAQDFYKTFNTFCINCDKIDAGTLCVRTRRTGDAIRLTTDGGSRTLKRLMIDRRIPRTVRDCLAVIADQNGVIAVENIGIDIERTTQTGSALIIQLKGI